MLNLDAFSDSLKELTQISLEILEELKAIHALLEDERGYMPNVFFCGPDPDTDISWGYHEYGASINTDDDDENATWENATWVGDWNLG